MFNKDTYIWSKDIDYRKEPQKYRVGKGEQGVLLCEPYKSEILPYWKFKTPEIAHESSDKIYALFLEYLKSNDFIGADMARKFLQMGFTRARRYYNYKGGKKYDEDHNQLERGTGDAKKYESSNIFYLKWREAEENSKYKQMKQEWLEKYG
ncbi:MAG: hypothetical protein K0R02_100 [Rickettsiaceae bacterium]|jgi:hypothetical protein|nr:hypothetical protein [Rickettsiaceae bacterium]